MKFNKKYFLSLLVLLMLPFITGVTIQAQPPNCLTPGIIFGGAAQTDTGSVCGAVNWPGGPVLTTVNNIPGPIGANSYIRNSAKVRLYYFLNGATCSYYEIPIADADLFQSDATRTFWRIPANIPPGAYTLEIQKDWLAGYGTRSFLQPGFKVVPKPNCIAIASAANYKAPVANASYAAAFGGNLASTTLAASTIPLPTTLGNIQVRVTLAGTRYDARINFISPGQINFVVPDMGTTGNAEIEIFDLSTNTQRGIGEVGIVNVAPGLFTPNGTGSGVAAGTALRVKPGNPPLLTYEAISVLQGGLWVSKPIDLGPDTDTVYLVLSGTGIRYSGQVTCTIGGVTAPITYAGPDPTFIGVDQINILIPRSLIGRGEVDVKLTASGLAANTVKVRIQ